MIIEKSYLEDWGKIKSRSDIKSMMADNPDTYYKQYYRALNGEHCEEEIFKIIHEFYAAKQQRINQIIKQPL